MAAAIETTLSPAKAAARTPAWQKGGGDAFGRELTYITDMAPVSSPCCRVCVVDPVSGLCKGCGRTLAEIARWGTMSEAERRAVMAGLDDRMRQAFTPAAEPAEDA
jgi:predicted Fe-S protein YdhL (DUF1289 family)